MAYHNQLTIIKFNLPRPPCISSSVYFSPKSDYILCIQITKLKIESNPFAKGFRDSSSQDGDDPFPSFYPGLPGGMPGQDPFSHLRGGGPPPPPLPLPHHHHSLDNNNILEAAEKARIMMLYRHQLVFPPTSSSGLSSPSQRPPAPPLSADLLARYNSAVQATLGLYSPSLLAAALRNSAAAAAATIGGPPSPLLLPPPPPHMLAVGGGSSSALSLPLGGAPKHQEGSRTSPPAAAGLTSPRFSPDVLPQPPPMRKTDSPSHLSAASDDEGRSPASSPPPAADPRPPSHPLASASIAATRPAFSLYR